MGRALPAFSLFFLLFGLLTHSWGNTAEAQAPANPPWVIGIPSEQQFFGILPHHAPAEVFHTTFASNVIFPSVSTARLRDLAPDSERPRIEQLSAATTLFNGRVSTEAEVARSQAGAVWFTPSMMSNARTDASARMFRVGLTGSEGNLRYGLTFRHAEQGFLLTPDRANREVWGEWRTGWVTVRNSIGQTWDNVEAESTRSRREQTYGRVGLLLNKPSWPEVSVAYARNSFNSVLDPIGVTPQRSSNHAVEGAIAFHRASWDLRLASSYTVASDLFNGEADGHIKAQTFSAVVRPTNQLVITPVFTYRQELRFRSGVRIEQPVASLAMSYQRNPQLLFSTVGNYGNARSSDGLIDNETLWWKGMMDWAIFTSSDWITRIAFEAGYNRSSNRVLRSNNMEDISGLVRFRMVAR